MDELHKIYYVDIGIAYRLWGIHWELIYKDVENGE